MSDEPAKYYVKWSEVCDPYDWRPAPRRLAGTKLIATFDTPEEAEDAFRLWVEPAAGTA